jgi:hypothetical protein
LQSAAFGIMLAEPSIEGGRFLPPNLLWFSVPLLNSNATAKCGKISTTIAVLTLFFG